MARKKLVYLQLYTNDYTGDTKLRMCSPEAWGVYSYLLCLLNSEPIRGAYKMSLLEERPHLKKSLTQQVLSATSDTQRLHPFAEILQRQMPWKKIEILRALRELLFRRIIVIEGDMLIQPRMYREGGRALSTDTIDNESSEENGTINGIENGTINGTINVPKKEGKKRTFSSRERARTHIESMRYENINNNSNSNKDVRIKQKNAKKTGFSKDSSGATPAQAPAIAFSEFWRLYDKDVAATECEALWNTLTDDDRRAIMDYIPHYFEAQPNKRFRKNPETFLSKRAWEDEIIREQSVQRGSGRKHPTTVLQDTGDDTYDNVEGW